MRNYIFLFKKHLNKCLSLTDQLELRESDVSPDENVLVDIN